MDVASALSQLGLRIPQAVQDSLQTYVEELERWNRAINLTALKGEALVRRLVAEPAWIAAELGLSGRVMDVGSGNGSPAIPMGLVADLSALHLIEARAKRSAFLRHVVQRVGLKTALVQESRLEDLQELQAPVDWITLQGVRLSESLGMELRRFSDANTKIVWITSGIPAPGPGARRIAIPNSDSDVWIFSLDQFCPLP